MKREYERFTRQRTHGQPGHLVKSAAKKPNVQPLLEQHIDLPFAHVLRETDCHLGICTSVTKNRVTEEGMERCRNGKSYPQRSGATCRNSLYFFGRLGHIRENASCSDQKRSPGLGEGYLARISIQQLRADLPFQGLDVEAQGRLANVQAFGRTAEVKLSCD